MKSSVISVASICVLAIVACVPALEASDSSAVLRRVRKNSRETGRREEVRRLKSGSEDADDDVCLSDDNLFRTCGKGKGGKGKRGRQLSSAAQVFSPRVLKKSGSGDSEQEAQIPPDVSDDFNLEIGDIVFTLGANIEDSLANGCDCRLDVEEGLVTFIAENFNNDVYNFFCGAIIDFGPSPTLAGATTVTTTLTFQVENDFEAAFEAGSPCTVEEAVLCCVATAIDGASVPGVADCSICDLAQCATLQRNRGLAVYNVDLSSSPLNITDAALFRKKNECEDELESGDLQNFLGCFVEDCVTATGQDANFFQQLQFFNIISEAPTVGPTTVPTVSPTDVPTDAPTDLPTDGPTAPPTNGPTDSPTMMPSPQPGDPTAAPVTPDPTSGPTEEPTEGPTEEPTDSPTEEPTESPTESPTDGPTDEPTLSPSDAPTVNPTFSPTFAPTLSPTFGPTSLPSLTPTFVPTILSIDTSMPTVSPTDVPTSGPTLAPSDAPTTSPTAGPTAVPTFVPSFTPTFGTEEPTDAPTFTPTISFSFPFSLSFSVDFNLSQFLSVSQAVGDDPPTSL